MMVDPKMVELSVYNDIPHLLIPVVDPILSKALKVVDEMENRYELFAKVGFEILLVFMLRLRNLMLSPNTNKYLYL